MRPLLSAACLAVCFAPGLALGQVAPPPPGEEWAYGTGSGFDRPEPEFPTEVGRQELFALTPLWRLEPQTRRLELRYAAQGAPGGADQALELRGVVGLSEHWQLAVAEDVGRPSGGVLAHQGSRVALRYAVAGAYGQVPGNPVLEAEFHPRRIEPARAAVRAAFSGAPTRTLLLASSLYLEQNLERRTPAGVDGAFGATLGAAWRYKPGIRLGGEAQLGFAQQGGPDYRPVLLAGPMLSVDAEQFTLSANLQADLSAQQVRPNALLTVARSF